ncbi:cysteine proteinase [Mucidula mucida]|nr:cysteine proteinase [Mucidula mucida]
MASSTDIDERPSKRTRLDAPVDDIDDDEDDAQMVDEPVRASDLYLDTVFSCFPVPNITDLLQINRAALDFDFEKVCSVSTSNINVYGCLVCGKYFQGRGRSSYAYAHSIHDDHHVFINLETTRVYVLPDGYLVSDPSLEDIAYVLRPTFTQSTIPSPSAKLSYDLASQAYLPGYVGLNNIKHNDHMNVIIHALLHVRPLRDFLLLTTPTGTELTRRFATLARKIWNPRLFKAQVSPHEFLQEVNRASDGKFRLEKQGDPVDFLSWLLNKLHKDLGGKKKKSSSIVFATFQGTMRVETQQVLVRTELDNSTKPRFDIDREIKRNTSPFLFLSIDLPPPPLFQDSVEKNIIPQVSIHSVLSKYDGKSTQEALGTLRRYQAESLPSYLILSYKRFTKNVFVEEKNPTIVNFPLRGLDMREYLSGTHPQPILYDLVANVVHESVAGTTRDKENTVWKVHLLAGERWYQIQDLIVEEVRKEMIFLGETVLQVWEQRSNTL